MPFHFEYLRQLSCVPRRGMSGVALWSYATDDDPDEVSAWDYVPKDHPLRDPPGRGGIEDGDLVLIRFVRTQVLGGGVRHYMTTALGWFVVERVPAMRDLRFRKPASWLVAPVPAAALAGPKGSVVLKGDNVRAAPSEDVAKLQGLLRRCRRHVASEGLESGHLRAASADLLDEIDQLLGPPGVQLSGPATLGAEG